MEDNVEPAVSLALACMSSNATPDFAFMPSMKEEINIHSARRRSTSLRRLRRTRYYDDRRWTSPSSSRSCTSTGFLFFQSLLTSEVLPSLPQGRRFWSARDTPHGRVEGRWERKVLGLWRIRGLAAADYEDHKYMKTFRVDKVTFDQLYDIVGADLEKQDTAMRKSIPGRKRMAIFVHWMAHGTKFKQLAEDYCLGVSTVHNILHSCITVFELLVPEVCVFPTGGELEQVMEDFKKLCLPLL